MSALRSDTRKKTDDRNAANFQLSNFSAFPSDRILCSISDSGVFVCVRVAWGYTLIFRLELSRARRYPAADTYFFIQFNPSLNSIVTFHFYRLFFPLHPWAVGYSPINSGDMPSLFSRHSTFLLWLQQWRY